MDATKTARMIEVMQAYINGKEIQYAVDKSLDNLNYQDWASKKEPIWNWEEVDYRIKPKPLDMYLNIMNNGKIWGYATESEAVKRAIPLANYAKVAVHVREVMDE